jgi:D-serine deaminase-like pyridoxal phosphate-dependent protein
VQADLPRPLPPVLHPGTHQPVGPDDLAPLFPMQLIMQEVSQDRWIEIPDEVREIYKLWRPTPLLRARRLEKALDTPALLVDLTRLDAGIAALEGPGRVAAWVHKTPGIARLQLAGRGMVGIALRSIAEAEVFAAAGFEDIRVLRPLATAASRRRAERLGAVTEDDGMPLVGSDALDEAVTVSARVASVPQAGRAIHDAGQKAVGRDFGDPQVAGGERFKASAGSAEHGMVIYPRAETPFAIGDWLELRPADVATAFALHDFAYGIRDGVLEAVWPVAARGAF